jgi:outer membrane lipoprotein-sorting protein
MGVGLVMTWFRTLFILTGMLLGLASASLGAPAADPPLDAVLARLDQAAINFKGLTADIRKIAHTDVVNVDDVDSGTIVTVGGGKVQVFKPKTNEAQEVELGKNRGVVDQFMLLGFGSNSSELRSAYTMASGGMDSINGEKTTRIILVPKDPEILTKVKKCELWISDKGWTVQQKFHTGGGDYILSTYSAMKLNPIIADKDLKLELPKGVKFGKLK